MRNYIKKHKEILGCLLVLVVYLSPSLLFLDSAHILIHDNLDSNVVWYTNLSNSGNMFGPSSNMLYFIMNGIPRGCYPSELNIHVLLYYLFNPKVAYHLNILFIHFVAFFGMIRLLKNYSHSKLLISLVSLSFALLPFWPAGGLSVAGIPLLLSALRNFQDTNSKYTDWLILFIFPFYSDLFFSGIFLLLVCGGVAVFFTLKMRNFPLKLFAALFLLSALYILVEYRLFGLVLSGFKSHRDYLMEPNALNWKGMLGVGMLHFVFGHYHAQSSHVLILLFSVSMMFVLRDQKFIRRNLLFLFAGYMVSLTLSITKTPYYGTYFHFIQQIGIPVRFYILFPVFWYIYFAWVIFSVSEKVNAVFLHAVIVCQCVFVFFSLYTKDYYGTPDADNIFVHTFIDRNDLNYQTFDEYYHPAVFSELRNCLHGYNQNIGCIGIIPEIAQFNGFNTVGAYFYFYPAEKGFLWQKVNRKELLKMFGKENIGMPRKAYLMSEELNKGATTLNNLDLDYDELKKVNCNYLFTIAPVNNSRLNLTAKVSGSYFLYKIN